MVADDHALREQYAEYERAEDVPDLYAREQARER
jgi:hypothetical protein